MALDKYKCSIFLIITYILECTFIPVNGKEVHSGNIEAVTTKEKAKFPQEFFPECKWSRKGFLRTRWSISGTVFDLINIHLFHDASNFIAMEMVRNFYECVISYTLVYVCVCVCFLI